MNWIKYLLLAAVCASAQSVAFPNYYPDTTAICDSCKTDFQFTPFSSIKMRSVRFSVLKGLIGGGGGSSTTCDSIIAGYAILKAGGATKCTLSVDPSIIAPKTWVDSQISDVGSAAVILAPGSSSRNVVQSTGDYTTMNLKDFNGQTQNLLEWSDHTGANLGFINNSGDLYAKALGILGNKFTVEEATGNTVINGSLIVDTSAIVVVPDALVSLYGSNFNADGSGNLGFGENEIIWDTHATFTEGIWHGTEIDTNHGGTSLTHIGDAGQVIAVKTDRTGLEWVTPSSGSGTAQNGYQACGDAACTLSDTTRFAYMASISTNRAITCATPSNTSKFPVLFSWGALNGNTIAFSGCTLNGATTYTATVDSGTLYFHPVSATAYRIDLLVGAQP